MAKKAAQLPDGNCVAKSGLAKKVHTVFWTGDIVAWYKLCRQDRFVFFVANILGL